MYKDYENVPQKRLSVGLTPTTMEHLEFIQEVFKQSRLGSTKSSVINFLIEMEYEHLMRERELLKEGNQE